MKKNILIIGFLILLAAAGAIYAGTADTLFPSAESTDQLPAYRPGLGDPALSSSYGRVEVRDILALEADPIFGASPAASFETGDKTKLDAIRYKESSSGYVLNGGYTVIETKLHRAITVTEFYFALNENPTTEIDVAVYYRVAGVGEGTLIEIYSGTTTDGVLNVTSGWTANTIPSGSEIVYFTNTEPDPTTYFQKASIVGTYN